MIFVCHQDINITSPKTFILCHKSTPTYDGIILCTVNNSMNLVMLTLVTTATALYSCGWKGSEGQQTWYCLPGSVHGHSTSLITKCSQHCHFTFKLNECWGCLSATTKYRLAHLLRLRWSLTDHKTLYKTFYFSFEY